MKKLKKKLKIALLIASSIVIFILLFFVVMLLFDINNLNCPSTTLIPILSMLLMSTGIIIFNVYYLKEKKIKVLKVLTTIFLSASILLLPIGKFVNQNSCLKNNSYQKVNTSNYTDLEVITYLEGLGYKFKKQFFSDTLSTIYTILRNENIWIQRIDNIYSGKFYTFNNEKYNKKHANILYFSKNATEEEKEQYAAYEKWLMEVNITDSQLISAINYYYSNNDYTIIETGY